MAAACRDLQSVSFLDFSKPARHGLSDQGEMLAFFIFERGQQLENLIGKLLDFIFLPGFRIRVGIFGLGFRKFAILEATPAS